MGSVKPNFDITFDYTMVYEGDYSQIDDETYKGINRKHNPTWAGWATIDNYKAAMVNDTISSLNAALNRDTNLQAHVKEFYYSEYWLPLHCEQLNDQILANVLFDTAVNIGKRKAILCLQQIMSVLLPESLLLDIDGKFGAHTMGAINTLKNKTVYIAKGIQILRGKYYIDLAMSGLPYRNFICGWLNRVKL